MLTAVMPWLPDVASVDNDNATERGSDYAVTVGGVR
ncbi:MAG: hypothetical protein AVDCRST_MAG54-62 [uncultured Actinomycetospora sp.]|uniref:Uncharacterized protein n=1 Tax=uncultured Actinomycetospora sp. TaxID=1135996 RepID=A0A6J4H3A5_9PSEU|nr:MAG: hypothetical protein AVDCRST_MAG54-62 [uncultured Actinomycetospora sp.]